MQANDFDAFFQALHDRSPFPWQSRLAKDVCEHGLWPDALSLPTSSGKTAALDIALFHLIHEATKPVEQRHAPRRIYFVVDRRLIVDEAYERSRQVAERLKKSVGEDSILGIAAKRLLELTDEQAEEPLMVIRLRGGMPLERTFIRNPLQPAIILTTVDQLGSRLLFRGYGVSANMRPIHAALTAMDSLILLDEAHLSQPFLQTLTAIDRYRGKQWCEEPVKLPSAVVQMTATPNEEQQTFGLQEDDYSHPLLNQRLSCSKPAELVEVKATEDVDALAKVFADHALEILKNLLGSDEQPVVGIVVNRVATARSIFELLRKQADTILLTGRIRETDRDNLLEHLPRMKSGRKSQDNSEPLFVVATQTIEVGADLDFDALVTEAASLDALRQRFGRLNRLGQRLHCRAVVLYAKAGKDDPIYGEALPKTWKWLNEHSAAATKGKGKKTKQFDFGIQTLNTLLKTIDLTSFNMRQTDAPVLLPAHLDALVQTSPSPKLSPDPALLLHGPNSQEEDVQLVWRADLPEEISEANRPALDAVLQALPPAAHETLSIPLYALKAFLRQEPDVDVIDLEGGTDKEGRGSQTGKPVYVWQGKDNGKVANPSEIKPGNIVVLPASYKGADEFGWFPAGTAAVKDVAEELCLERRGKYYLRLHPNLAADWFEAGQPDLIAEIQKSIKQWPSRLEEGEVPSDLYDEVLQLALDSGMLRPIVRDAMKALLSGKRSEIPYPALRTIEGVVLTIKQNVAQTLVDDDDSTSMSREISLESHCLGVAETVRYFAERIGLHPGLSKVIEHAALFHDLGKADPRFQALLQGGCRKHDRLLAKSAMNAADRRARQTAQKLAEYPQGQRHECYSVALLRQYPQLLAELRDPELAQYLAGSHHGRGRPYMPAIEDEGTEIDFAFIGQNLHLTGEHGLQKLDSGWVELFWRMVRRYGYWGLAFLETIVRLADQQRSEWESKNEQNN